MRRKIIKGGREGVALGLWRRLLCQKRHEAFGCVVAIVPLDKAMQIADAAQRIDLDIEKQLHREDIERDRLAQIRLGRRTLEHDSARLQLAETIGPHSRKHRLLALNESVRIDRRKRGDCRNAVAHHVAVGAAEKWYEGEIVRSGELRDAVGMPVAKLADTGIARERNELSGENRARIDERRFIIVPQALARQRAEVVRDLLALDIPDEAAPSR